MSVQKQQSELLLTVTGPDGPGITAKLSKILAEHEIALLDVEQVVVRGQLTLCFLLNIDQEHPALKELLFAAKNLGQELQFRIINKNIDRKKDFKGSRFAVTLLGDPVSSSAVHVLSRVLSEKQANIDWIRRLSEKELSSLEVLITLPDTQNATFELKKMLMSELQGCGVDVALQRESLTRRSKRLVVFDMDSTLIPLEVIDEMGKMHGVYDQISQITHQAMQGLFDFSESLKKRVAMLEGLPEQKVLDLVKVLPLNEGAEKLMRVLKGLGYKVGIISGGFDIAANKLCERLDLDFAYANKLEIANGRLTGRVHAPIIDAAMKAQLLLEVALRENIPLEQTIAIGDGANDAEMLAKAGLGIAFHAKAQLKKVAATSVSSGGLERILYMLGMKSQEVEDFLALSFNS